jgi:hypothetical protein
MSLSPPALWTPGELVFAEMIGAIVTPARRQPSSEGCSGGAGPIVQYSELALPEVD